MNVHINYNRLLVDDFDDVQLEKKTKMIGNFAHWSNLNTEEEEKFFIVNDLTQIYRLALRLYCHY